MTAPLRDDDDPPRPLADRETRLRRLRRERDRNNLDELRDTCFDTVLAQARALLPDLAGDACFAWIVRRLWRGNLDVLPDDLGARYRAVRADVAWMEDGVERVDGVLTDSGLGELARLLAGLSRTERRLAEIAHGGSV